MLMLILGITLGVAGCLTYSHFNPVTYDKYVEKFSGQIAEGLMQMGKGTNEIKLILDKLKERKENG